MCVDCQCSIVSNKHACRWKRCVGCFRAYHALTTHGATVLRWLGNACARGGRRLGSKELCLLITGQKTLTCAATVRGGPKYIVVLCTLLPSGLSAPTPTPVAGDIANNKHAFYTFTAVMADTPATEASAPAVVLVGGRRSLRTARTQGLGSDPRCTHRQTYTASIGRRS